MAQILLVDDNPVQASTRKIILERTGSAVKVASSGMDALSLLADPNQLDAIKLIITDHLMPRMNGPELVRTLRARNVHLPVLVLSGLPDAEAQYEGLDVTFRLKPFHPDSLIALAHLLLDEPPMQRTA
jgi:DNA-binding response OmpR family regulator